VFTRAAPQSPPRVRWIQSTSSHVISLRSILKLSPHLRLDLFKFSFPFGFPD
jgi:hypothetical protein